MRSSGFGQNYYWEMGAIPFFASVKSAASVDCLLEKLITAGAGVTIVDTE